MSLSTSIPGLAPADSQREEFGRRLRELRKARGLTLAEVAEITGLAVSTVSKVERGLMALTYDRLMQLSAGMNMDMPALFGRGGASFQKDSMAVARLGDFQLQETPTYSYEILFPDMWHKAMTPMAGTVKAHSRMEFPDLIRHPGQEFVFVLSGQLTIFTDKHEPVHLGPGESVYLDSGMGHVYTSAGEEDARILVVCLPG
ncbi:MAG: XRE family transcriptional regulator [Rhizobiaceae bacterium]